MSYITKTYLETQFKNFAEKIKSLLNNKVDKVEGKGLSTNDLTSELKSNYDTAYTHSQSTHARTDATKVESSTTNGNIKINGTETTVYTHPTTTGNKHIPSGGSSGQILRWSADGTAVWGADNNTTYSDMTGATSSAAGTHGLVPAPASGKQSSFLRGDGTWAVPTDTNTWRGIQNNLTSDSTTDSLSAAQGKILKGLVDGKAASSHTHDDRYYTETEIDNKLDSISSTIFNNNISKKDFTYVVYNPDTLRDWIENKSGNDYTSVLIKKGTYSYEITDSNNFISVNKQGTLYIEGETGSNLNIVYLANTNSNYSFILGCENESSKLDMFPENTDSTTSTDGYKRMSLNNVNIVLSTYGHKNSSEYYMGILKYANGISNCKFIVVLSDSCKQTTACCYYGCTNLNNCKGITTANYDSTLTNKTGYDRLRPYYGCSRVINCYAYGSGGYSGGAFYNGDHIINCNAKFENMYYSETFYGINYVIGCRSYSSGSASNIAYNNCKRMLHNLALAGSYSNSYSDASGNSTYLCANTLNGGWNS